MRAAAAAARERARSLRGRRPAQRMWALTWATVRPRVRELVRFLAAARARGAWTMVKQGGASGEAAGKEAVEEAGDAGRGTREVQAAAGPRRGRMEKAAGSGRRQTETREEAARGGSEHEGRSQGNVSTIGEGARARSAEGAASASTIGKGARARSAEGRASASTIGKGAGARRAKQTRTSPCRWVSRSSEAPPHFFLPSHLCSQPPLRFSYLWLQITDTLK